ncbi:unnamed protein product [Calypogeia fissa]
MKPIHKVTASGKTEIVRVILEIHEDSGYINTTVPFHSSKWTPLYFAIDLGDNVETIRFLVERGGIIPNDPLVEHLHMFLNSWELADYDVGALMYALHDHARALGHKGILKFLRTLSTSSAKATFRVDREQELQIKREGPKRSDSNADDSYVRKILADFEMGASKEIISLHFSIEFPTQLAGKCCEKGYLGLLQFLNEHCGLKVKPVYHMFENWAIDDAHLLHTAARFGHVNVVQFLLLRGYPVNSSAALVVASPLDWACYTELQPHQKCEVVSLLLDAGADPKQRDSGAIQ